MWNILRCLCYHNSVLRGCAKRSVLLSTYLRPVLPLQLSVNSLCMPVSLTESTQLVDNTKDTIGIGGLLLLQTSEGSSPRSPRGSGLWGVSIFRTISGYFIVFWPSVQRNPFKRWPHGKFVLVLSATFLATHIPENLAGILFRGNKSGLGSLVWMGSCSLGWGRAAEGHRGGEEQRRAGQDGQRGETSGCCIRRSGAGGGGRHQDLAIWLWAAEINGFGGFAFLFIFE